MKTTESARPYGDCPAPLEKPLVFIAWLDKQTLQVTALADEASIFFFLDRLGSGHVAAVMVNKTCQATVISADYSLLTVCLR